MGFPTYISIYLTMKGGFQRKAGYSLVYVYFSWDKHLASCKLVASGCTLIQSLSLFVFVCINIRTTRNRRLCGNDIISACAGSCMLSLMREETDRLVLLVGTWTSLVPSVFTSKLSQVIVKC